MRNLSGYNEEAEAEKDKDAEETLRKLREGKEAERT